MPLLTCPHCGSALDAPEAPATLPPPRCPVCGAALTLPAEARDVSSVSGMSDVGAAPASGPRSDALVIREAIVRDASHEGAQDEPGGARDGERDAEDDSATRPVAPERLASLLAQAHAGAQVQAQGERNVAAASPAPTSDEATQTYGLATAIPAAPVAQVATRVAEPPTQNTPPQEVTRDLPISALPPSAPPPQRPPLGAAGRPFALGAIVVVMLGVIAVAALVANGALGGVGAATTPTTATATVAPTATPLGQTFSVKGYYTISYPTGWTAQQRNSPPQTTPVSYYALLSSPTGDASVNIEAQQASGTASPALLDQQFLSALTQPGTTPSVASAAGVVAVGGQQWTPLVADVTLRSASGQSASYAHVVILSTQRGASDYTIVYLAPTANAANTAQAFAAADTADFQPMLASFTFLQ